MDNNLLKNNPVCSFISALLIIVFSLYVTNAIKNIPCDKNMTDIFISNFIHTDYLHLVSNLYGIYSLSRLEIVLGPKKFILMVCFLLLCNTILETLLHKIIDAPCSIGFSGILYGVLAFEIVYTNKIDYFILTSILSGIVVDKIKNKKSSLSGHIIGIISGIFYGLLYKKV